MAARSADSLPFSPAAERNQEPILAVLRRVLPASAHVLEIASGTGQHAHHFAAAGPGWRWQPTDADPAALASIDARCRDQPSVQAARVLDVLGEPWPPALAGPYDAVCVANLLHIAPWAACPALMRGAASVLRAGGQLVVYGPFVQDGVPTAPTNVAFDADLRARDPRSGLRALADVGREAARAGLALRDVVAMPANNLLVVFAKAA